MDDSIFHILMEPNPPSLSDSVQRVIRPESPDDAAACSCSAITSRRHDGSVRCGRGISE